MTDVTRRTFLAGSIAATALGGVPRAHAQKRGGTLRFVPHADLKILDPIWTTAYITRNHGYMIYDTCSRSTRTSSSVRRWSRSSP